MSVGLTDEDLRLLRSFVPLYTLSVEHFDELVEGVSLEEAYRGQTLFTQGETSHENIYLLSGQLTLLNEEKPIEQISAGSNTARFPIAHASPRKYTARAHSPLRFVRVDSRRLSDILAREHTSDYQVNDLDESAEDDWMTQLLHSPVMQQIPAANIQRVMMCVERVEIDAGTSIIRQGEPGDYYYMLNRGQAVVSRDNDDGGPPVELARLGPGSSFGEEALLSDAPRNSTVTMLTNGIVVRLSKQDFVELIHHSSSTGYDLAGAKDLVANGAVWLDVRSPELCAAQPLLNSLVLPFDYLRDEAERLTPDKHYVVVADSRAMAASAAFLLTDKGCEVSYLDEIYGGAGARLSLDSKGDDQQIEDLLDDNAELLTQGSNVDEVRFRALQERITELEAERNTAKAERQHSLEHLKEAIDKTRGQLQDLEQERLTIEDDREQLKQQLGELQKRFKDGELEREGMRQELADVADRETVLKKRLRKIESQGVEDRDRAESASQQYEDLARKLAKSEEQRQLELDHNARSLGELKEQITELQLERDLVQGDLEDAHEQLQVAREQHTEVSSLRQGLLSEKDALRAEVERSAARAEELAEELNALRSMANDGDLVREDLAEKLQSTESQAQTLAARLDELRSENQRLETQLRESQELGDIVRADWETRESELQTQLETRRRERDAAAQELSQRNVDLTARQAELEESGGLVASLQHQLAAAQQKTQAVEQEIATRDERLATLEQSLTAAESERARFAADVEQLRTELATTEQRAQSAEEQSQTARIEIADLNERLEMLDLSQTEIESARTGLAAKLEQLRGELQASEKRARLAEEQRLAANQARSEEAAVRAALASELEQLQQKYSRFQDESEVDQAELQKALETAQTALSEAVNHATALEEEVAQAREAVTDQADAIAVRLKNAEVERAQLHEQLSTLGADAAASTNELSAKLQEADVGGEQLQGENDALRQQLDSAVSVQRELNERLGALELERTNATGLASELQEQLTATAEELVSLQRSHSDLQSQLEIQVEEGDAVKAEAVQDAEESSAIATKAAELEDALAQSTAEREELRAEVKRLDRELDEARADIRAQRANLDAQSDGEFDQVAVLEEKLFDLKSENERLRNAASLAEGLAPELEQVQSRLEALRIEYDQVTAEAEELRAEQARELRLPNERQAEPEDELAILLAERDNLRKQIRNSKIVADDELADNQLFEAEENLVVVSRERDDALSEASDLRKEVENLRSVMEKYVDQIRAAQSSTDDVEALIKELAMVREQADNDVAQLRQELEALRAQLAAQQRSQGEAPLTEEAMRQEVASLREALAERQRELATADLARQRVEDQLEDAAREIERLRRLTGAKADDLASEKERDGLLGSKPGPVETDPAEVIENLLDSGLRDRRVRPSRRTLDMEKVTGKPRTVPLLVGLLVGLLVVVGGLEAATYLSGRGELFTFLFG